MSESFSLGRGVNEQHKGWDLIPDCRNLMEMGKQINSSNKVEVNFFLCLPGA